MSDTASKKILDAISSACPITIKEGHLQLHIDYDLPHFLLYIYEDEAKTQIVELLRQHVSYCIAKRNENIQEWIAALGASLAHKFNSSLIIELSNRQTSTPISICSPLLENNLLLPVFETKLKDYNGESLAIKVEEECVSTVVPDVEEQKKKSTVWLNLSISDAISAHSDVGQPLTEHISESIKKLAFEFMRLNTSGSFSHSMMYGKIVLDDYGRKTDKVLTEVSDKLSFLKNVTPANAGSAREDFKKSNGENAPFMTYRLVNIDAERIKRQVSDLPFEKITAPALSFLFREKRYEIEQKLIMLENRGNSHFRRVATNLFGKVEKDLLEQAKTILKHVEADSKSDDERVLDCHEFAELAKKEIAYYQDAFENSNINYKIHDDGIGLMVDRTTLYIDSSIKIRESRAAALIQHEVGTHILTYCNGLRQPITQLSAGLAQYDQLQEGLAVFSEYLVGGLSHNRLRLIAARVISVDCMNRGYAFPEAHRLLTDEYGLSANRAFNITLRVFRGGGFAKDAVYLRGLSSLLKYLQEGGDLELLYVGKIHLNHVPLVRELLDRGILKEAILPNHFHESDFVGRLKQARRKDFGLTDLI